MVFVWIQQGVRDPYIPKIRETHIDEVFSLNKSRPANPLQHDESVSEEKTERVPPELQAYADSIQTEKMHQRKKVFFAHEIMSHPIFFLHDNDRIDQAEDLFREKRFRHIPVIDDNKSLCGIISDRDILKFSLDELRSRQLSRFHLIREIMVKKVLAAQPEAEIREIARLMFEERVGSIPIVDASSRLIGIITRSDILRKVMNNPPIEIWA